MFPILYNMMLFGRKPKKKAAITEALYEHIAECEVLLRTEETKTCAGHYPSAEWLVGLLDDRLSFVMLEGDKVVGCLFGEKLKSRGALLHLLAVHPDYRHLGIGTALLTHFERACYTQSIDWVLCYVTTLNPVNKAFIDKMGYFNHNGIFYEYGKYIV